MEEIKLKPCPFCGGEATISDDCARCNCGMFVECETCSARAYGDGYEEVADAWNTRPTEWVSVEERLPEKRGIYLVSSVYPDGPKTEPAWFWMNRFIYNLDDGGYIPGVTHWRPMPEPPEVK